jgi:hypothetical protein
LDNQQKVIIKNILLRQSKLRKTLVKDLIDTAAVFNHAESYQKKLELLLTDANGAG